MDPNDKQTPLRGTMTLGDLISYYYDKFSAIYDSPELRDLAVKTTVEELLTRSCRESNT